MSKQNKKTVLILMIILSCSLFLNIATFKNGHDWGGDFAGYIYQAKSLVDGTIDELDETDRYLTDNSIRKVGNIVGSWGFPLLLSPVYYWFGLNIFAMKILVNIFFILSLCIVFILFRDRLSDLQNLLLVTIIALNTWFFDFKDNVLSDIPFMFFSLLTLYTIQRFIITKDLWLSKLSSYSLIGLMLFFCYNLRSVGLVFIPLLFSAQFIESRISPAGKTSFILNKFNYVPYGIFIVLSVATSIILPDTSMTNYLDILVTKNYSKMFDDIMYLAFTPSRFFPFLYLKMNVWGFSYNKYSLIVYGIMLMFIFAGMSKNIKKDYLFILYVIFTIPVLLTFSQRAGARLIIPLFPIFLYFLFIGLSSVSLSFDLSEKLKNIRVGGDTLFGVAVVIMSLVYVAHASYQNIIFNRTEVIDGPYSEDSVELFDFIETNINKNDAVIFHKPRVLSLYTGRKSAYMYKRDDILTANAEYLAFYKKVKPFELSVQDLRNDFNCIFENDTFLLCSVRNIK